jgi:type I restriction enzyme S subunit
MKLLKYSSYFASDIPWIGLVPKHWSVSRLKNSSRTCTNGTWGDEPTDDENDIRCVRVADFDRNKREVGTSVPTIRSVVFVQRQKLTLKAGDLLIEKSGGGENQLVGTVVLYNHSEPAVYSNFIGRLHIESGFDPNFLCYLHYFLYSLRITERSIKQTTGIQNLDTSAYLNEKVAFPPYSEQTPIAAFLDNETTKIDELISCQEELIELLNEKRQAVISQAVTKGLDPHVPMKQSGIEWLGVVPAHWGVLPTRYVARLESGHTPSRQHPEYWENCTIPWFSLSDVWQVRDERKEYVYETSELVSELGIANSSARVLPKGTVLLSRTASVGFSAIMGVDMATTQDFANWVCGPRLRPEYLLYVFRAMKPEFSRLTMGSTHQTIYMPDLHDFRCPLPPIEEQDQIVSHIRCGLADIDAITEKCNAAIKLLQERRIALISAAVTGKFDVRSLT